MIFLRTSEKNGEQTITSMWSWTLVQRHIDTQQNSCVSSVTSIDAVCTVRTNSTALHSWIFLWLVILKQTCQDLWGKKCDFSPHFLSFDGKMWFIWFMSHCSSDGWCKFQLINELASDTGFCFFWGTLRGSVLRTSFPSIFDVPICLAGCCWWLYTSNTHKMHKHSNTVWYIFFHIFTQTRTRLDRVMWRADLPLQLKESMNHPPCVNVFHHS